MGKQIMMVQGLDASVELMTDRIVIHRGGIINAMKYGLNARREIPIGAVSEVVFRPATSMRFGTIEFVRGGRSAEEKKKSNPGIVKFSKKHSEQFEVLKEKVFEFIELVQKTK